MIELPWIDPSDEECHFPDVSQALLEPDGLLAFGGNLNQRCLLKAYRHGIFPWYNEGEPILWWSPDPRTVLFPDELKISRSLKKTLRKAPFQITLDRAFNSVMAGCAEPRKDQSGTWIDEKMGLAYQNLHRNGHAHSVEAWQDGELVGGLYGVAIGKVFFGESMFSRATDASKVATAHLVKQLIAWDFKLIDCQVYTDHLASLGAREIRREQFTTLLNQWCDYPNPPTSWPLEIDVPCEQTISL
ncbi:leucyl/phenylalanyl-tRNA--protein transferase [Candidatus Reidiella endopervernicosa]|uniref:Leucyl/phenylalanyl-tRNA--protein transferase n=1 Tax=Candidatus Reidiella endopervernicosa TaxID=2738883 RepID=A0A6N0HWI5_9GAMM|nr:leucyl/phenylalanyl-tRNA--protein transferase [Candidatus Reidiella endopervernicosa]QKQ26724.1 leucyl/phenylalanyl-tRNA--protein transferase [Candidatus Reidiella endopervernicosa]